MNIARLAPRRVVLSYGTFDRFTSAHAARLQALSQLGNELIIGCATDAYCTALGVQPLMDFTARREMLESCRFVSRVIAHDSPDQQRTDIVNYNVGMFAMPAEWQGHFDDLQDVAQVYYLPHAPTALPLVTVDQNRLVIAL